MAPDQDQPRLDPQAALAELGTIDLRADDLQHVLQRVAELAKRTIPGADEVSVSLLQGGAGSSPAFTGRLAVDCDESQYSGGHGPCMEAANGGTVVLVEDVLGDDRWPDYLPQAAAAGAGSSVSVGLPMQQAVVGALNIYATKPHAFDDESVELARTFAGYAAVAVANAQLYATSAQMAAQMQEAMASRAVIEQAKGILMAQRGCSVDEAFQILVRASSNANRKLRDIAADLVQAAQHGT